MAAVRRYLAYLVRPWTVNANGNLVWRASVENAHTGERCAFTDLAGLFDFLQTAVAEEPPARSKSEGSHAASSEEG